MRIRVVLLVSLVGGLGVAKEEETVSGRDAFLARLVPILTAGIQRADTEHAVFHGSVDWHSAVHAHWALFRIARTTGAHAEAAELAVRSLSAEGLAAETKLLRDDPAFEMPYGRAWALLLATEFEAWSREKKRPDPERLRPLAKEAATSLREFLARTELDPDTAEYANHAWALAQLRAWAAATGDEATRAWAAGLVRDRFLGHATKPSFAEDVTRPEFFSRFGNWAYLVATGADEKALAAFLEAHPVSDAALAPVKPAPKAVHQLGMNWSRAWALLALSRRAPAAERERFRKAYDAHVEAGLRDHETFAGDVWAYDHWVPQFAVYALTDAP